MDECMNCNGTGNCPMCNGTGFEDGNKCGCCLDLANARNAMERAKNRTIKRPARLTNP